MHIRFTQQEEVQAERTNSAVGDTIMNVHGIHYSEINIKTQKEYRNQATKSNKDFPLVKPIVGLKTQMQAQGSG